MVKVWLFQKILKQNANRFILAGTQTQTNLSFPFSTFFTKIDSNGNILATKIFRASDANLSLIDAIITQEGTLFCLQRTNYYTILSEFDTGSMNLIRQRVFNGGGTNNTVTLVSKIGYDGEYYMCGTSRNSSGSVYFSVMKFSKTLNLIYQKHFGIPNGFFTTADISDLIVLNGAIYAVTSGENIKSPLNDGVIFKLKASDGNLIWAKGVGTAFRDQATDIMALNNTTIRIGGNSNSMDTLFYKKDPFFLEIDTAGNLLSQRYLSFVEEDEVTKLFPNGDVLMNSNSFGIGEFDALLLNLKSQDTLCNLLPSTLSFYPITNLQAINFNGNISNPNTFSSLVPTLTTDNLNFTTKDSICQSCPIPKAQFSTIQNDKFVHFVNTSVNALRYKWFINADTFEISSPVVFFLTIRLQM